MGLSLRQASLALVCGREMTEYECIRLPIVLIDPFLERFQRCLLTAKMADLLFLLSKLLLAGALNCKQGFSLCLFGAEGLGI